MEVYCIVNRAVKLSDPTRKVDLREPLAYDNAMAHAMQVTVFNDDGTEADLSGIGVTANFKKANNETVSPINGTVNGNVAQVILPPSCYVTPGRYKFTMNLNKMTPTTGIASFSTSTSYAKGDLVVYSGVVYRFIVAHPAGAWNSEHATPDGAARTVLWVEGIVERNTTDTIVDPGTPISNVSQAIGNANAATASASSAAFTAINAAAMANAAAATAVAAAEAISIATVAQTTEYLGID